MTRLFEPQSDCCSPADYLGPIHVNASEKPPTFLPELSAQILPVTNPYASFYTTHLVPRHLAQDKQKSRAVEHEAASKIERYVPESFREQSDLFDQVVGGYASHTRGEQSKVLVTSAKGRVVIGYRESTDEREAMVMGLNVGAKSQGKKKRWWRG